MRTVRSYGIAIILKGFSNVCPYHAIRRGRSRLRSSAPIDGGPIGSNQSLLFHPLQKRFSEYTSRPTAQQTGSTGATSSRTRPERVVRENPLTTSRRILPDLLSVQVDPVAERMQRLAHERATRRREQSRAMREQVPAQETVAAEQAMTGNATPVSSSASTSGTPDRQFGCKPCPPASTAESSG